MSLPDHNQIRAFDHNVVRWRYDAAGNAESNARFVRWSDGSLQLQVGTETLDVTPVDVSRDNGHLFVRVPPPASILAAQAPLGTRLTLRPSSLNSKSHKLLAAATAMRHAKVTKVKKTFTTVDPEREKLDLEKEELARIKDRDLLARKQAGVSRRYALDGVGRGSSGALSKDFLEGDDDAAQAAPLAIRDKPPVAAADKPKKRKSVALAMDSDSDSEGSWSEERPKKGNKRRVLDSDDD